MNHSLLAVLFWGLLPLSNSFAIDAESLLKSSDLARGGLDEGITWNVQVQSNEDGETKSSSYLVKARDLDAIAECVEPARNKGQILLFNDRNLWMYKPGLRKPVSISPRQRLSGQAANGDIAATHYAKDYTATVLRTENYQNKPCTVLHLKAKGTNVTYDQIHYWVSNQEKLALRADFLTLQGQVFKRAEFEYENKIETASGSLPFVSKMTITDATFKDNVTTLKYQKPQKAKHAPSVFNVNNLVR